MKCMGCYKAIAPSCADAYHEECANRLFGTASAPSVDFAYQDLVELAEVALGFHQGLTGVQPKIPVMIEQSYGEPSAHIKIGQSGTFILKPSSSRFPDAAVVEDLTMHMAKCVGITTADHGLLRLNSGEFAYITRRFDRGAKGEKIRLEDFCQLSGQLTDSKYASSTEKAGKVIQKFCSDPGREIIAFFDLTLFCFLTGNADMHLKNFSLIEKQDGQVALSPAYDLLATALLPIDDKEELALPVNGKKARIKRKDFEKLGANLGLELHQIEECFHRITEALPDLAKIVDCSFLSDDLKSRFKRLLAERTNRLA